MCVCMGVRGCLKECWWASQSVCLHSSLSGRDVHRANEKHMRPPVPCQLVMYPHACARAYGRTHTHTHTIPAIAPSLLHSSLSFFFLSCFKSCWTGLGLRWFLCGTRHSLLWLWHHTPTPWCVIYLHGGQRDSRGLPHSSTEVEGPLKAKPHPSQQSVLCTVPHWGILWENIDFFILIIVGEGWESKIRGGGGTEWMVNATVGWGQFIWLGIVITLGFWQDRRQNS